MVIVNDDTSWSVSLESSFMILESSVMLLKSSIMLLENFYSTGVTHDCHMTIAICNIEQATGFNLIKKFQNKFTRSFFVS
jgi:hypothetical protein